MSDVNEMENVQEASLEEMFEQLDSLIEKMQGKDMTLEETFAGYKQGLELVEKCSSKIEKIECDIKLLSAEEE